MTENNSSSPEEVESSSSEKTIACSEGHKNELDRRTFLSTAASVGMVGGLVASYGTFAGMAGSYLYPSKPVPKRWMYVANIQAIRVGDSITYYTPAGAPVAIARQAAKGQVDDFIALSSTCPHLGCKVHWEGQNNRFFCPCHNGVFDPSGKAVSGPPADANQNLPEFPLKLENDLLYIEVPIEAKNEAHPG